jgi:hypothetical protein
VSDKLRQKEKARFHLDQAVEKYRNLSLNKSMANRDKFLEEIIGHLLKYAMKNELAEAMED